MNLLVYIVQFLTRSGRDCKKTLAKLKGKIHRYVKLSKSYY